MKTFELTQEQIDQLAEKKHAKELLKEFIPEAFKTKLEVGKWHKKKEENNKTLFVPNKETCDDDMGYGFTYLGKFKESNFNLRGCFPNEFELATEEEVLEALINEAKKRGYKNIYGDISNDFCYEYESNTLRLDGAIIFNNGKWAEIIEETEPTKEEINRVLTFLKNQNEQ